MDCFIKRLCNGKTDTIIHLNFQKFSRGNFNDRGLIRATHTAKGYSVNAGAEYANDLVRSVAEKLGNAKTTVTGVIVSTHNLKDKVPSVDLKQFMGIKQYVINGEMAGTELIRLVDMLPEAFFALSFTAGDTILKIKPKAPKSAKPKTSEEPPKADFCSLKTTDTKLINEFIFDMPDTWKSFEARHTFAIKDIEIPASAKTPEEMRTKAVRKGTIIRKATVDGNEKTNEVPFSA